MAEVPNKSDDGDCHKNEQSCGWEVITMFVNEFERYDGTFDKVVDDEKQQAE